MRAATVKHQGKRLNRKASASVPEPPPDPSAFLVQFALAKNTGDPLGNFTVRVSPNWAPIAAARIKSVRAPAAPTRLRCHPSVPLAQRHRTFTQRPPRLTVQPSSVRASNSERLPAPCPTQLVEDGFFDDSRLFEVVDGSKTRDIKIAQAGISGDPAVNKKWASQFLEGACALARTPMTCSIGHQRRFC